MLFRRILEGVVRVDPTFGRRMDVVGHWSPSPELKIIVALCMIAHGCTTDSLDEYFQLRESTALDNLQKFCTAVVHVYGPQYSASPLENICRNYFARPPNVDFLVCTGSGGIVLLHGQDNSRAMFVDLQFCSRRLRDTTHGYMHAYFDTTGSLDDINILGQSPIFDRVVNGSTPQLRFKITAETGSDLHFIEDSRSAVIDGVLQIPDSVIDLGIQRLEYLKAFFSSSWVLWRRKNGFLAHSPSADDP
ncbi:hypothetical protein LINPERPRIM_LOCUS33602 [Linum perenne]